MVACIACLGCELVLEEDLLEIKKREHVEEGLTF